ncbi:aspartyl/glutamyl-tRNA(Asn/Gln) amidotransferase subunit C [Desulfurobacterium pacificum]|jgi:aspartyl-tRNA(Asn)/glutamyl-tRNA(Gln) amidotransferase subunit C|uniref:Aspartyl/glutamyl-tRNA(Asn/Gln) amidotransferase subunit C n=1 Tax=Desulfurobacterium pacificum TaxID=240166 RepID=A0ABY1NNN3_9BACT|nr:Asp-tRNA(Asn)/Glu-tRNA(Gln) amidotransferase subunit GatC [Desulfurobacterium pacificum]SMP13960.1 aspartyl/glutamyl-tRNA(Asn/Gln) amidotransferase subunit C [Desulfurobacterium pacificum]
MKLSKEEVKHIAMLSRLTLSEEEVEKFQEQLSRILDFVEKLNELDTEGIDPKFQIIPPQNVLREDVPGVSLPREKALMNAPETDGEYFIVPKVVRK